VGLLVGVGAVESQEVETPSCLRIELYVRPDSEQCRRAEGFLAELERRRPGIRVEVFDVSKDPAFLARLREISAEFGRQPALPTVYAANQLVVGFRDAAATGSQIEGLLTMEVFVRNGCPKCAAALPFVQGLQRRYPGLAVAVQEVTGDRRAAARMNQLCQAYGVPPGLPTIHFGGRLVVGWNGAEVTGAQLEGMLRPSATPCRTDAERGQALRWDWRGWWVLPQVAVRVQEPGDGLPPEAEWPAEDGLPPEAELPVEADPGGSQVIRKPEEVPTGVTVPVLGRLDAKALGLPVFTFLIGLVDGFNPCAMWVLVFLLSVLVGLKDRRKIVAIAGTFVVISGMAYFVFMAAWLNVFLLIGYVRPAQIVLGAMAVVIGLIHVKDFFAFKKGISLSIPESAKPTIYARVRQIVTAENLVPALLGAMVLAVLVNSVELLCTAGLPAVYTQILSAQGFPLWVNYAYLGLYIAAYMLDDTILLAVIVATLSRKRLEEKQGRWLKLVSGSVILALGVVMLVRPDWLR
jgi:glutaredoxin